MNPIDPRGKLSGVHPALVNVMTVAGARSTVPFIVIHGLRTIEEEQAACASGHSETMHSRHLPNAAGLACAVDVAAEPDGAHIDWQEAPYHLIAEAVKEAASELNVPITWGGDWHSLKDFGHFELPWKNYP